jgi:hypothetical protein
MEQRLVATHLRPGIIERAAATAIYAGGIGAVVLLAAWGISLLWRYTPPEMVVRIANPDLHVIQNGPLMVAQDKPFALDDPKPLKIESNQVVPVIPDGADTDAKTAKGQMIRREVTVFLAVKHGPGNVVTGWTYKDGGGGVPLNKYCYYSASNIDGSTTKVDIAANDVRVPQINASLVPDLEEALGKCQWSRGS